jgi:hypothetical protein
LCCSLPLFLIHPAAGRFCLDNSVEASENFGSSGFFSLPAPLLPGESSTAQYKTPTQNQEEPNTGPPSA